MVRILRGGYEKFDFNRSTKFPEDYYIPFDGDADFGVVKKVEVHIPEKIRNKRENNTNGLAKSSMDFSGNLRSSQFKRRR